MFSGFGHGQYCKNHHASVRQTCRNYDEDIHNVATHKQYNLYKGSFCKRNLAKELRQRSAVRQKSLICGAPNGIGACPGDNGAGVVFFDKDLDQKVLIGLVSFSASPRSKCTSGLFDYFLDISEYYG